MGFLPQKRYFDVIFLTPCLVSASQLSIVTVFGRGFVSSSGLLCKLGKNPPSDGLILGSSAALCPVFPLFDGTFALEVSTDGENYTSNGLFLSVLGSIQQLHIFPTLVSEGTQFLLTIRGISFKHRSQFKVIFDGIGTCDVRRFDADKTECVAPDLSARDGDVRKITVSLFLSKVNLRSVSFWIIPRPVPVQMIPSASPITKGGQVRIIGFNLFQTSNFTCRFVSGELSLFHVGHSFLSSTSILCSLPSNSNGDSFSVQVSNDGIEFYGSFPFLVDLLPEIAAVKQNLNLSVFSSQGYAIQIDIYGKNFRNSAFFACSTHTPHLYFSSTHVACALSLNTIGNISVEVSNDGIHFSRNGPWISLDSSNFSRLDFFPHSGPVNGGTMMTIIGLLTASNVRCVFNGIATQQAFIFNNSRVCRIPAQPNFTVQEIDVFFKFQDGTALFSGKFQYFRTPSLSSINPSQGPIGENLIEATGSGFYSNAAVGCYVKRRTNNEAGSAILRHVPSTFLSESRVNCLLPNSHSENLLEIRVSNDGMDFSEEVLSFLYMQTPEVSSFSIIQHSIASGQISFRVVGKFFKDSPSLGCSNGHAVYVSSSVIHCMLALESSTNLLNNQTLEVSNDGKHFSNSGIALNILGYPCNSLRLGPSLGPTHGRTVVRVTGIGSEMVSRLQVGISQANCSHDITSNSTSCEIPYLVFSSKPLHYVDIFAKCSGRWFTFRNTKSYLYFEPPILYHIVPSRVTSQGGVFITVFGVFHPQLNYSCAFRCNSDQVFNRTYISYLTSTTARCLSPSLQTYSGFSKLCQLSIYLMGVESASCTIGFIQRTWITAASATWDASMQSHEIKVSVHNFTLFQDSVEVLLGNNTCHLVRDRCIGNELFCYFTTLAVGNFTIDVKVNNIFYASSMFALELKPPLQCTLSPSQGPSSGGYFIKVHINGTQDETNLRCKFGRLDVKTKLETSSSLLCEVPPLTPLNPVIIHTYVEGSPIQMECGNFFPYQEIENIHRKVVSENISCLILKFEPSLWQFRNDFESMLCMIESTDMKQSFFPLSEASSPIFKCILPNSLLDSILTVCLSHQNYLIACSKRHVVIISFPTISNLRPTRLNPLSSSLISISGNCFDTLGFANLVRVDFGNHPWQGRVVTSSLILSVNPKHLEGFYSVALHVEWFNEIVLGPQIHFSSSVSTPIRLDILPSSGPVHGGTLVRISSEYSSECLATCLFASFAVIATAQASSIWICKTPTTSETGYVKLRLQWKCKDDKDVTMSLPSNFLYWKEISISSVFPSLTYTLSETKLLMHFDSLQDLCTYDAYIKFLTIPKMFHSSSKCLNTKIMFTIPALNDTGIHHLDILLGKKQTFYSATFKLSAIQQPTISSVLAYLTSRQQHPTIRMIGYDFKTHHRIWCKLGNDIGDAKWISSSELKCSLPNLANTLMTVKNTTVSISNNGVDYSMPGTVRL
eukprot:764521-Hanusia_phi.AAC.1